MNNKNMDIAEIPKNKVSSSSTTNAGYTAGIEHFYVCISAYKEVERPNEWSKCPNCGLIPKIWRFDNGVSTACGCGKNAYDHFSIYAESVMSWNKRHDGNMLDYNSDELKDNWNHWCKTGEILFDRKNSDRW